jgi:hypothetical protein
MRRGAARVIIPAVWWDGAYFFSVSTPLSTNRASA